MTSRVLSVVTGRRKVTADDLRRVRLRWFRRLPPAVRRHLPPQVAVPILSDLRRVRPDTDDHRSITVPEPYRLVTYWLRVGEDEGPAASLFLGRDEILRLDCLAASPHVHYGVAEARHREPCEPRVYFPPGDMQAQIDRAVHELRHNVGFCTGLHRRRSIRRAPIDPTAFDRAADELGDHFRTLVAERAR